MDQSFNDQELSDIMKEIEALEEDFASQDINEQKSEDASHYETGPEEMKSVHNDVEECDEVLEELIDLEEHKVVPQSLSKPHENVVAFGAKDHTHHSSSPKSTMNFKLQGDMTMELSFEMGGKVVWLNVTESGLSIEMDGGMKFSLPVSKSSENKKAV